jgi:hypothetical protein
MRSHFQKWECVSCRYYAQVHNTDTQNSLYVLVIREKKNGFSASYGHTLESGKYHSSLDGPSSEQLDEIKETVTNAFSHSECENDERIAKIKKMMINQTLTSIMEAERQNDKKILEIISSLPYCSESVDNTANPRYLIGQMSLDLISQLK